MSNDNVIKGYVHQIMNLELDRMTLDKTNKKMRKIEEDTIKIARKDLLNINKELDKNIEIFEEKEECYQSAKAYRPHGLLHNLFFAGNTIPILLLCFIASVLGFAIGHELIGILVVDMLGVKEDTRIRMLSGIIFSIIGWCIGQWLSIGGLNLHFNFVTKKQDIKFAKYYIMKSAAELNSALEKLQLVERRKPMRKQRSLLQDLQH